MSALELKRRAGQNLVLAAVTRRGQSMVRYVRSDAIEDVLASLDFLALVLPLTGKQPFLWKWAIIAAHSSFQGVMACVLGGASGVSVPDDGEIPAEAPREWLGDFEILLKRVQANSFTDDEPLHPTPAQLDDINKLHDEFRNNFEHFAPKAWSIEKASLPRIISTAVDCTEMLMGHTQVLFRMTGNRKRRLTSSLKSLRTALARMRGR
jgi:hypothetical protein